MQGERGLPDISVVVLAYGAEPYLEPCVEALLDARGLATEVVLVDNGCTDGTVDRLAERGLDRLIIVRPGENLGYAEGCNTGARSASADVIAFVNYDAIVAPDALAELVKPLAEVDVGIATGSIRLAEEPELLNSAGNDIHFLGLSWSGRFRELAASYASPEDVTGASGAGMALRRDTWEQLGGFEPEFFMYHDDTELSLRCHLLGYRIVYVPAAVIYHRYDFSRNPRKFYLIERNRQVMYWTSFERKTLLLLFPALLTVEVALFALAAREGWALAKFRAWGWQVTHASFLRTRRREIQASRVVADRDLAPLFVTAIEPGNYELSPVVKILNHLLTAYWRVVRPRL